MRLPDNFLGIHSHTLSTCELEYSFVRSWDQPGCRWDKLNPQRDVFNWVSLDAWVDYYGGMGKELIFTLSNTPTAFSSRPTEQGNAYGVLGGSAPPMDMGSIVRFWRAFVQRYEGKIKYVEIWNEPGLTPNIFWSGTPSQLAIMTRVSKQAISQISSTIKVISGPPANITTIDTMQGFLTASAKGYALITGQDGAGTQLKDWIDIIGIHGYALTGSYMLNIIGTQMTALKTLLAQLGIAKPVWCTEVGVHGVKDMPLQDAVNLVTMTIVATALAGCEKVGHYSIDNFDMGLPAGGYQMVQDNINKLKGVDIDPLVISNGHVTFKREYLTL